MSLLSGIKLFSAASVLLLVSIPASAVSISDVLNDPRTYVDHTVTIEGTVTGVLSLMVFKYYTVQDGGRAINVITERPLPRKGQRIRVVGKVHEGLSWGEHTLLVLIEGKDSPAAPSDRNQGSVGPIEMLPGSI